MSRFGVACERCHSRSEFGGAVFIKLNIKNILLACAFWLRAHRPLSELHLRPSEKCISCAHVVYAIPCTHCVVQNSMWYQELPQSIQRLPLQFADLLTQLLVCA